MFFQSFIQHHQVSSSSKKNLHDYFLSLVLYFDRIPLVGNFIITITVGLLVGLCVMIFVKPRLKHSIEGERRFWVWTKRKRNFSFQETLKKKRDLENKVEKPQLTKTEGRFETYTGKYNFSSFVYELKAKIFSKFELLQ